MTQIEADAYAAAKEQGMTVVELTPEQLAAWKAGAEPVLESYKEAAGDLGAQLLNAATGM